MSAVSFDPNRDHEIGRIPPVVSTRRDGRQTDLDPERLDDPLLPADLVLVPCSWTEDECSDVVCGS